MSKMFLNKYADFVNQQSYFLAKSQLKKEIKEEVKKEKPKPPPLLAYCLGPCNQKKCNTSGVHKDVKQGTFDCPECKSALVWKRRRSSMRNFAQTTIEKNKLAK